MLVAASLLLLHGCYRSHQRATFIDAGSTIDSGAVFDEPDTNPPPLEVGPTCTARDTAWRGGCTPEIEAECQRIAADWARGRYAHTRCITGDIGGGNLSSTCAIGNACDARGCGCSFTRGCGFGDVCVSDTPDGLTRCVPRCTGR